MTTLATYWSMTINNPDETTMVLIRNPNPKYIRELVWTLEKGEEGTDHVQAWIRLQRNNSMAFVKKLYPRGHFKYINKDAYNENCQAYAQKEDETTNSAHVIKLLDPLPTAEGLYYRICSQIVEEMSNERVEDFANDRVKRSQMSQENNRRNEIIVEIIMKEKGWEKVVSSPTFKRLFDYFYPTIIRTCRDFLANKQTNKQEEETSSRHSSINDGETEGGGSQNSSTRWEEDESEDLEDDSCSEDEGYSEGSSYDDGEEDD